MTAVVVFVAAKQAEGWTWEATATIIQAVATIIALAGVAVTFIYAARAEKRERQRAEAELALAKDQADRSSASAERAERAATLSIDTLARIAGAIESLADKGLGSTVLPVLGSQRVRWTLEHFQGDTYILTNVGTATAHNVRVSADPTLMLADQLPAAASMRPDDTVTFMAARTMDTRDSTITVTWADSDGPGAADDVWRYPLPPRPPRA